MRTATLISSPNGPRSGASIRVPDAVAESLSRLRAAGNPRGWLGVCQGWMAYPFFPRRMEGGASPHSGLTGPADIPEPPENEPSDFGGRLRRIREALLGTVSALPRVV